MMSAGTVLLYMLVDEDGDERGPFDNYQEALRESSSEGIVEYEFEFSDSRLVYTPGGETQWIRPGSDGEMMDLSR